MTDREKFEAWAYRELKQDARSWRHPSGEYVYLESEWKAYQAAIKAEREAIASLVEQSTLRARQTRAWGDAKQVEPCEIAAAIRARGQG